jgi:hypothetical protein
MVYISACPPVICFVFVSNSYQTAKEYAAEVMGVSREDIDVKFEDGFVNTPQATYDVRFTFTKIFAQYAPEGNLYKKINYCF